jgi:protein-S-isoprenylcysteine O-methyltransferase
MIHPLWLGLIYGVSEIAISTFLRSKSESSGTDKGSLRLIWMVINLSMVSGIFVALYVPAGHWFGGVALYWIGFAIFAFGLALRWYSIAYLGKFFTVDVTIAAGQKVIDTGPYRFIRHPSYTGVLLAFLGFALCLGNIISMALILMPITAVLLYRIRIEESALQDGLGQPYQLYMQRTKRLIPFLY